MDALKQNPQRPISCLRMPYPPNHIQEHRNAPALHDAGTKSRMFPLKVCDQGTRLKHHWEIPNRTVPRVIQAADMVQAGNPRVCRLTQLQTSVLDVSAARLHADWPETTYGCYGGWILHQDWNMLHRSTGYVQWNHYLCSIAATAIHKSTCSSNSHLIWDLARILLKWM